MNAAKKTSGISKYSEKLLNATDSLQPQETSEVSFSEAEHAFDYQNYLGSLHSQVDSSSVQQSLNKNGTGLIQAERDGYTVEEFAQRSGMSTSTVRRRIKDGSIPIAQPGGPRCLITIPADALEQIVNGNHSEEIKDSSRKDVSEKRISTHSPGRLAGPQPKWKTKYLK